MDWSIMCWETPKTVVDILSDIRLNSFRIRFAVDLQLICSRFAVDLSKKKFEIKKTATIPVAVF